MAAPSFKRSLIALSCDLSQIPEELAPLLEGEGDFVIRLGDYEWLVHSELLSKQSSFFDKVCNGCFREGEERTLTLHEDDPYMFGRMLLYLYHTDTWGYSCFEQLMCRHSTSFDSDEAFLCIDSVRLEIERCALTYLLADKYDITFIRSMLLGEWQYYSSDEYLESKPQPEPEDIKKFVEIVGLDQINRDTAMKRALACHIARHHKIISENMFVVNWLKNDNQLMFMVLDEMRSVIEAVNDRYEHHKKGMASVMVDIKRQMKELDEQIDRLDIDRIHLVRRARRCSSCSFYDFM